MNRFTLFILSVLVLFSSLLSQEAQVTNVVVAQRTDGSKLVDITYDITEDAVFFFYSIEVQMSLDNSENFTPISQLSGDVGLGIEWGNDKYILWNLGEEFPNIFFNDAVIRIIAEGQIFCAVTFDFVTLPEGEFTYLNGNGDDNGVIFINYTFKIMKYEVTNAEYTEYLIAAYDDGLVQIAGNSVTGHYPGDEYIAEGDYTYYALGEPNDAYNLGRISWNGTTFIVTPGYGDHPVTYVSWFGAWAMGDYYGLRLPNKYEWQWAAIGNTGFYFPWGYNISGENANYRDSGDPWDNGTTPVNYFGVNGEGPFGVRDMTGNVGEWNSTCADNSDSINKCYHSLGNYSSNGENPFNLYIFRNSYYYPTDIQDDKGFRLAKTIIN